MEIKITYLDNSGFLAETEHYNFIFDYYNGKPDKFGKGVIDIEKLPRKPTFVFASHNHYDHYNPAIFSWLKDVPDITYVFSSDIRTSKDVFHAEPDKNYNIKGLGITTFKSTDEGAAFLIKAEGQIIYHAGDLNWWDWEGEPKAWLNRMERDYKEQISKLKGEHINVAFAPVDPRLERTMGKGARFLIDTAHVDLLIPMHYGSAVKAAREFIFENFPCEEKTIAAEPLKRGESLIYTSAHKGGKRSFEARRFVD